MERKVTIQHTAWRDDVMLLQDNRVLHLSHGSTGTYDFSANEWRLKIKWDRFPEERFILTNGVYVHEPLCTRELFEEYRQNHESLKLEIGAGSGRKGWFATSLEGGIDQDGNTIAKMDGTKPFCLDSNLFEYIYCEHMIEHITYECAEWMLSECFRVLKPGGIIRIVTPSLGFILGIVSGDPSYIEEAYKEWSIRAFAPGARGITNAFFLNNFVRNWGHTFIYDRETMRLSLKLAGFEQIEECNFNHSNYKPLNGIEHDAWVVEKQIPLRQMESMVFEAKKYPERV